MDKKVIEALRQFGSLGGKARAKRKDLPEIAKKTANALIKKYGADYFKKVRAGKKIKL